MQRKNHTLYQEEDFAALVPKAARLQEEGEDKEEEDENDLSGVIFKAHWFDKEEIDPDYEERVVEKFPEEEREHLKKVRQRSQMKIQPDLVEQNSHSSLEETKVEDEDRLLVEYEERMQEMAKTARRLTTVKIEGNKLPLEFKDSKDRLNWKVKPKENDVDHNFEELVRRDLSLERSTSLEEETNNDEATSTKKKTRKKKRKSDTVSKVENEDIQGSLLERDKGQSSKAEEVPDRSFSWLLGPSSDEAVIDAIGVYHKVREFLQNPSGVSDEKHSSEKCSKSKNSKR